MLAREGLLGCCALEEPLDEDVGAACADLLLDLVRDACALQHHVHPLGDVLVAWERLPLGHLYALR